LYVSFLLSVDAGKNRHCPGNLHIATVQLLHPVWRISRNMSHAAEGAALFRPTPATVMALFLRAVTGQRKPEILHLLMTLKGFALAPD
jgi:hypothetical protein